MEQPAHPPACALGIKRARLRDDVGIGDDHRADRWPRIINRRNPREIGLNQRLARRPPSGQISRIFRKCLRQRRLRRKWLRESRHRRNTSKYRNSLLHDPSLCLSLKARRLPDQRTSCKMGQMRFCVRRVPPHPKNYTGQSRVRGRLCERARSGLRG